MILPRLLSLNRTCLGVALAVCLLGCGDSAPRTHPVEGKIVFKAKGGSMRPLIGGRVRLQSMTEPGLFALGEIEDGGAFSVGMIHKERPLAGVPAGQYKVRIELPDSDDGDDDDRNVRRKPGRAVLHPKYRDFDKSGITVTVPTTGEVVLTLDPPK